MKIYELARNLFFPPRCASCKKLLEITNEGFCGEYCLCPECRGLWQRAKLENCPECLCPSSLCLCAPTEGKLKNIKIPKLITYTPERNNIQGKMIFALKRINDKRICEFASNELAVSLCTYFKDERVLPDSCIYTYVPRRRKAICEYGFDQGRRLSYGLAKACEGEFLPLFERVGGKEQKKLDKKARETNVNHAIDLRDGYADKVKGRTVVVVDDLITTGATLGRAVQLLRKAGAANIYVTAVGKTCEIKK